MSRLISTAAHCRALDAALIDSGLPGIALMELASRGVATVVQEHLAADARRGVAVLAGPGQNGGDGYGAARWLDHAGFPVHIVPIGDESPGDAGMERSAAQAQGITERDTIGDVGLVVDALFGTGLSRAIEGRAAQLIQEVADRGLPVVAVDLPSGLLADSGQRPGPCLDAVHTATFGRLKPAFFTPGGRCAGRVHVVDIGIARAGHALGSLTTAAALARFWPRRDSYAYKQSSGHLAIVAGSVEMAGAAVLACRGAIAGGAGLVTLMATPEALARLTGVPATVMIRPLALPDAFQAAGNHDAWVVGPGIGGGSPLSDDIRAALAAALGRDQPVVVDADALLPGLPYGQHCVLTPHPGEAARLLGIPSSAVQDDRFAAVADLPGTALLKGRHTLVHGDGRLAVNPTGSPVLATAGSGDVLTGLIGALLGRGLDPFDAARAGAWIHGRAGELLAERRSEGWSALDVADALPDAIEEVLGVPR